jgi:hypothetical protein
VLHVVALVLGIALAMFLLHSIGLGAAADVIARVGGWFAVIALIDVASIGCDAYAIHGLLRPKADVAYRRVVAAQASGVAINRLTPGNSLGEPIKVAMLVDFAPAHLAVSAIAMFYLATVYVGITVIVVGVPITAISLDLPQRVLAIVAIAAVVLVVVAIAIPVLVRRGAGKTVVDAVHGARLISHERAARWRTALADIDTRMRDSAGAGRAIAGVVGSRLLNWVGTVLVIHAAGIPMTGRIVFAILTVGQLITWLSNVIPLGLGLQDGGNYVLYGLLGASPDAGLLFTIVNRVRTLVLATIGLCVLAVARPKNRT